MPVSGRVGARAQVGSARRIAAHVVPGGRLLPRDGRRARANLSRLRRSVEKVHATGRALYYTREGWSQLLKGYAGE
jgi:hypothetical protein